MGVSLEKAAVIIGVAIAITVLAMSLYQYNTQHEIMQQERRNMSRDMVEASIEAFNASLHAESTTSMEELNEAGMSMLRYSVVHGNESVWKPVHRGVFVNCWTGDGINESVCRDTVSSAVTALDKRLTKQFDKEKEESGASDGASM